MDHASFEERLERNPLRKAVREFYEVKPLRDALDPGRLDRALHYCSRNGSGTRLLAKYFSIGRLDAVDPDEGLVRLSRETVTDVPMDFTVGSLTRLAYEDSSFDAVFVLGELHNYPEWRDCLGEIARVMKPRGFLFIEELSLESFEHGLGRYFRARTEHRYDAMLRREEFRAAVEALGFDTLRFKRRTPFGLFTYFVQVARKR